MADPGFPSQHTTTTTTSNTTVRTDTRFDPSYIKTLPGILKIVQIIFNLMGLISINTTVWVVSSRGTFFNYVSTFGIFYTIIFLTFYIFHIVEKYKKVPWLMIEIVINVKMVVFYLIAASLAITFKFPVEAFTVAGYMGYGAMIAYAIEIIFKYGVWSNGEGAQGPRRQIPVIDPALNLLGFICIQASVFSVHSRGTFFDFVSMTGFWFTGFLLLFYLFHIIEKFYKIPWLKIEFGFCALWTLFYLIASILAATFPSEAFSAAAFFGFCAMVAYGFDCYLKLKGIQSGQLAQGERVINKQTTTTSTPTY